MVLLNMSNYGTGTVTCDEDTAKCFQSRVPDTIYHRFFLYYQQ